MNQTDPQSTSQHARPVRIPSPHPTVHGPLEAPPHIIEPLRLPPKHPLPVCSSHPPGPVAGHLLPCQAWQIKTTPTFRMFRGGQLVHTVSGTRDNKVLDALLAQLLPGEAGADWNLATQQEESWA
eukprot:357993-Chlamydomonas_euryale.AAC.3